jgi:hypothetical protein
MVQVDVFWSYGLSAGLALAGQKQLLKEKSWWDNRVFTLALLWSAIVFAPSGLYLLWSNPGWETMFVARNHASIPTWLVTVFGITNITQGVLGFYVTAKFIKMKKKTAALWQPIWAHLAMFFILIFGWDGTGYKRFFYAGTGEDWHAGVQFSILDFFSSPTFYSLLGLGVAFLPTYFGLIYYLARLPRKQSS